MTDKAVIHKKERFTFPRCCSSSEADNPVCLGASLTRFPAARYGGLETAAPCEVKSPREQLTGGLVELPMAKRRRKCSSPFLNISILLARP